MASDLRNALSHPDRHQRPLALSLRRCPRHPVRDGAVDGRSTIHLRALGRADLPFLLAGVRIDRVDQPFSCREIQVAPSKYGYGGDRTSTAIVSRVGRELPA